MTESSPASILDGLTLEAVEWLPSGTEGGLVRVRGRWSPGSAPPAGLPVLCARVGGALSRVESLPDAPSVRGDSLVWRGAYLVPETVARGGPWLEWASGERSALPTPAGLDERAAPPSAPAPEPAEEAEAGGEVIDRAVLAERRARRAEAAEQAQARVASEALRALDALEIRGSALEARVEALTAERDALAEHARALERRAPPDEHQRRALSDALAAAAAARRQVREWRVRMRAAEVARSSDAVRLRVLEAQETFAPSRRAELAEQAAALAAERARADEQAGEAARAREQAVAAATDLDEARRDFARRLEAGGREAAETQGRAEAAETALGRARGELAALEAELSGARADLEQVRAQVGELERAVESERAARAAAGAEAETARGEAAGAGAALRAESVARAALEDELERERAARAAFSDALDAETDALASLHLELNAERAARAADQAALAALRDDLDAERAARGADQAALAALRHDLDAERAARGADQAALASLRAELEEARARPAEAGASAEGRLLDRVAELDRRAAGLAGELELQRRAREQAEAAAAAARGPAEESQRVVADLEAAAAALRERPEDGVTGAPKPEPAPAPAEEHAIEATGEAAAEETASAAAEAVPAAAPPERERQAIVSPPGAPARAQRQDPWLRGALVKFAHDDPEAAGRIIAGLLPAQAAIVRGALDYDLTIAEVGTFAVTIAGGRARVKDLAAPRGRRKAEFHLAADALTLAELIAGVPHRLGRFRGPARVTGRKRRAELLRAVPATRLSLAEVARAGGRLEPGLVFRAFPHVIDAGWARDHSFTVAQEIAGDPPETWYVTVGNGRGMKVRSTPPEGGADATVTMSPEAFGHLLRGEPAPAGHRPVVRGDRAVVALLKGWLDRAQGL